MLMGILGGFLGFVVAFIPVFPLMALLTKVRLDFLLGGLRYDWSRLAVFSGFLGGIYGFSVGSREWRKTLEWNFSGGSTLGALIGFAVGAFACVVVFCVLWEQTLTKTSPLLNRLKK